MRVGLVQNNPVFGEVRSNTAQVLGILEGISADLVVLPELFSTGYQFVSREEAAELGEEVPGGETCRELRALAKDQKMVVVFGLAEREDHRIYNSSAIVGPEGFVGRYRKTHLFAEETYWFDPGDTGFRVWDVGGVRVGIMICFDWWFPESARVLALMGADIICHPANLVLPHAQKAMETRSLENGVFTITANRVGQEARAGKRPLNFTGKSQIVDNDGSVLAQMGEADTGVLLTDIEPSMARDKAVTQQNDRFRDRRPEMYGMMTEPLVT